MFYSPTLGCSACGSGVVAFVVAADGKRLVLFCIQCGAWYASVEHHNYQLLDSTAAEGPDLQLVGCDCSVKFPPARWATAEEVRDFGWGAYLNPEPNRWLPDQAWPAAEWEARLRGVDVWQWHALQRKQPPQVAQPARRLLDPYGRPFDEPGAAPGRGGSLSTRGSTPHRPPPVSFTTRPRGERHKGLDAARDAGFSRVSR